MTPRPVPLEVEVTTPDEYRALAESWVIGAHEAEARAALRGAADLLEAGADRIEALEAGLRVIDDRATYDEDNAAARTFIRGIARALLGEGTAPEWPDQDRGVGVE